MEIKTYKGYNVPGKLFANDNLPETFQGHSEHDIKEKSWKRKLFDNMGVVT